MGVSQYEGFLSFLDENVCVYVYRDTVYTVFQNLTFWPHQFIGLEIRKFRG